VKLLLDTHIVLWALSADRRLPKALRLLIEDEGNEPFFSPINVLEVAIKRSLGGSDELPDPHVMRRQLVDNGYSELPVTAQHAAMVADLPPIHRDPFDRLLVAQSRIEGIGLLTVDPVVARYLTA
jgi:PIN domain nuclease of toxin-antitoxin system